MIEYHGATLSVLILCTMLAEGLGPQVWCGVSSWWWERASTGTTELFILKRYSFSSWLNSGLDQSCMG